MSTKLVSVFIILFFLVLTLNASAQVPPGSNTIAPPANQMGSDTGITPSHPIVSPTVNLQPTHLPTPTAKPTLEQHITPTPVPHYGLSPMPTRVFTPVVSTTGQNSFENQANIQPINHSFAESIQAKRIEAVKKAEVRRVEFNKSLVLIKDVKKKNVVEKIDNKITTLNQNYSEKMAGSLDTLQQVLNKISSSSSHLKIKGINTTSLDAAIISAQGAITKAKSLVFSQAAKEYIASISAETRLKSDVGLTVSQFSSDVESSSKSVNEAKLAVERALQELSKITTMQKTENKNATGSGLAP